MRVRYVLRRVKVYSRTYAPRVGGGGDRDWDKRVGSNEQGYVFITEYFSLIS